MPVFIPSKPGIRVNGAAPHGRRAVNAVNLFLGKSFLPEGDIGLVLAETGVAGEASDAFTYIVFPSRKCLVRKFRVCKALTSQFNEIRFSIPDYLVRKSRVINPANDSHL